VPAAVGAVVAGDLFATSGGADVDGAVSFTPSGGAAIGGGVLVTAIGGAVATGDLLTATGGAVGSAGLLAATGAVARAAGVGALARPRAALDAVRAVGFDAVDCHHALCCTRQPSTSPAAIPAATAARASVVSDT